ncbi:D-alanine--D-alanine ligase [Desulfamplus magnetovallimortis]|uniref:D-alanine--D-alanine ligase n=1 Tax=Desulfamplus magnetovallimortis TaxID=1246637 RepID=A0A1W1H5F6_9BACT|nr:D-alanine--D-alanine ligase [Desulfamplus magnetovallimortis]SLM27682.1 D-alanine--D-alanine ligase [Desulfamplus magnetovallimortis]
MKKINLALLSGGDSSEREVSLNSGKQVYEALDRNKYNIVRYDPLTDLKKIVEDASDIDVALLILHGPNGEDGTVQGLLDLLKIPYQGAGVLGSSLAMNKLATKQLYEKRGIPVPDSVVFSKGDTIETSKWVNRLGLPIVVKPVCAGSSVGMTIVRKDSQIEEAIDKALEFDESLLLEKYIKGVELTCGVLGNKELEALPVIEIIPGEGYEFFDYNAKYLKGATEEICPARIDDAVRDEVQRYALEAHEALFLRGYSRTDMILSDGKLYVLETNTIPGMTATSLYPQSAQAAGYSFPELLDRLISLAMEL